MKLFSMFANKKTFLKNSFMQYILLFSNYILPLLTFPYLTRVLGPEKFGIMLYIYALIAYTQMTIDFGFMLSATKDVVENREDKEQLGKILGTVIVSKVFLVIICFFVITLLSLNVELLKQNIGFTYLSFLATVFSILLPDYLFLGLEQMSVLTIRHVVSKVVTTILVFVLIKTTNDFLYLPILNILGVIISACLTWYVIIARLKIKIIFTNLFECYNALKKSSTYFIANIATTVFGALNTVLLGSYVSVNQIAYWGIGEKLLITAQMFYTPIINSIYPHMIAKKDFTFMKKIILIGLIPITIATALSFVYAEPIIEILCGSEFIEAAPVYRALAPILILSFPALLLGFPVLGVLGKVKAVSYSTVYTSVFHLIGMLVLISFSKFNILNLAILRSITELFILSYRFLIVLNIKRIKV